MATSNPNGKGFRPVLKPKKKKKAKTTPSGAPRVKPEVETDLRITFQLPKNPRREFQPAQQVKQLVIEMLKYDNSIVFHPLADGEYLYPQYDQFPLREKEFEQYFVLHPIPKRSIYKNTATIGCRLSSTKTIKDIKAGKMDESTFLTWLKTNHVFLDADTLGRKTIRTLGYLFFIHPQMTHHTSCKGNIEEALAEVKLTKDELTAIDPNALDYYTHTAEYADSLNNNSLEQAMDDYNNDNDSSKLLSLPFELYRTEVGYGNGTARVTTKVLGIKSNVEYGKLLNELLLRMKLDPQIYPNLQYVPVGFAATIGAASYMQLIRDHNEYLTSLTAIPLQGFNDRILNYTIPVKMADNKDKHRSIREILMATDWCTQIEPTQNPGRILLLTTRSQLETGREWLDDNLPIIFTQYLPSNPQFQAQNNPEIPTRADIKPVSAALDTYADALKHKLNLQPRTTNPQQFAHPPASQTPPLTTISYSAAAQKNLPQSQNTEQPKKKKARNTDAVSTATAHSSDTVQTSATTTTTNNLTTDILNTLRAEVQQLIQHDIQPLKHEIQTIHQTITTFTDRTANDFQQFHQKLEASQAAFNNQMAQLASAMKAQQDYYDAQMRNFFAHFNPQPPAQSPPSTSEGGMH